MSDDDAILNAKRRRLRELQLQQARYGNDTPAHITIEVEDLEREIANIIGIASATVLPCPPQPYFVHPYPLQANFTGRVAERRLLTEWLSRANEPILALIAIGGMGKSALSWAWVRRDVLGLSLPGAINEPPETATICRLTDDDRPDGVLWWSFYETQASFASFLDEAIRYASYRRLDPREFPSTYDKARTLLNILQQRRLLIVLDGFERELRAYANLNATYQGDVIDQEMRTEYRACTAPHTGHFLAWAAAMPLKSRILLTSRLYPRELDDLGGSRREDLTTIDPEDAVAFFKAQGIHGTRAEIQAACSPYGYLALALRLLGGVVKKNRRNPGDIKVARLNPILPKLKGKERHHILQVAYDALDERKRVLLSNIAAFRNPMSYDALAIFNEYGDEQLFDAALEELEERGLLFYNREQRRYDLHPVVRNYSYDRLTDKDGAHARLYNYFAVIPEPQNKKVQSIDELMPVIELYHHTVRAGWYERAIELYRTRLSDPLYYQFGGYQICIELLSALFPGKQSSLPRLEDSWAQIWTLDALARAYSLAGQPRHALRLFEIANAIDIRKQDTQDVVVGLLNLANQYVDLGNLTLAEQSLVKRIQLCRGINDEAGEAIGRQELGRLLAYQGAFGEARQELTTAQKLFTASSSKTFVCTGEAHQTICALLMGDIDSALESARKTRELAATVLFERDNIRAAWISGTAYVAQVDKLRSQQAISERENYLLSVAETHLAEALTRCRRINLIELEPDILLSWAKWHYLRGNQAHARIDTQEALAIADHCEYRLKQADIHNFLAQLALDEGNRIEARRHAEIARERAWCDGPPHCYKPALDEAERLLREIGAM